jgi:hypothetical protein
LLIAQNPEWFCGALCMQEKKNTAKKIILPISVGDKELPRDNFYCRS